MRTIELIREATPLDCITDVELATLLGNGSTRHSQVKRMLERGELKRVKRGLYLFGDSYRRSDVSPFYLSNLVYGPSYVSLESALSYYQLIPEAAQSVTAVTPVRTYRLRTTVSHFLYRKIPSKAFRHDVCIERSGNNEFLIGTREKSLLDKLYLDCKADDPYGYALRSLRIDQEDLLALNLERMQELAASYSNDAFTGRIDSLLERIRHG